MMKFTATRNIIIVLDADGTWGTWGLKNIYIKKRQLLQANHQHLYQLHTACRRLTTTKTKSNRQESCITANFYNSTQAGLWIRIHFFRIWIPLPSKRRSGLRSSLKDVKSLHKAKKTKSWSKFKSKMISKNYNYNQFLCIFSVINFKFFSPGSIKKINADPDPQPWTVNTRHSCSSVRERLFTFICLSDYYPTVPLLGWWWGWAALGAVWPPGGAAGRQSSGWRRGRTWWTRAASRPGRQHSDSSPPA